MQEPKRVHWTETENDQRQQWDLKTVGGFKGKAWGKGKSKGKGKKGFQCFNCGEEGHIAAECPNPFTGECWNCGGKGHTAIQCWSKGKGKGGGKKGKPDSTSSWPVGKGPWQKGWGKGKQKGTPIGHMGEVPWWEEIQQSWAEGEETVDAAVDDGTNEIGGIEMGPMVWTQKTPWQMSCIDIEAESKEEWSVAGRANGKGPGRWGRMPAPP